MTSHNCLDYATTYSNIGFSVIPIKKKSKTPSIEKWTPYRCSYPKIKDLVEWFSDSNNGIAIITGEISAIFAIDIDGEQAAQYYNDKINSSGDQELISANNNTMKIKTGSGNINIILGFNAQEYSHDKLKSLTLWKNKDEKNHSEIRIKAEGGYIVAPPSTHPNNNEYTLVNGIDLIILKREQIQKLIDLFSKDGFNRYRKITTSISHIVEILKSHYRNGLRNDLVLYFSGWLRKLGVSLEAAEELINELVKDDEEKDNRIRTLHETYQKQDQDKIAGYSGLLQLLSYDCNEDDAKEKLKKVKEIIDKIFGTSKNNKKGKEKKKGKEEIDIISLIKEYYVDVFVDQFNKPYIAIKIKGHIEVLGLDSQRFKNWLFRFFYKNTGEISSEEVENTIKVLKSEAEFNENRKRLELRVAKLATDNFTFYYDLTDSNWSAVKITSEGWTIENKPPILFRRYSNQLPQVNPSLSHSSLTIDDKDDNILDKFIGLLNVKDNDNKLLLKCYIISLFIPGIAKPILMLHGEQGSAKTTLQELIKMLVDPSIVKTLTFPRDINELIQQLSHNYIAYYDNISFIKEQISDALCRAVTGSGFSKRQLYTDDDDIIYYFQRCIGFNGINLAATKADLLDRGIIIQLERIPKEKRRKIRRYLEGI